MLFLPILTNNTLSKRQNISKDKPEVKQLPRNSLLFLKKWTKLKRFVLKWRNRRFSPSQLLHALIFPRFWPRSWASFVEHTRVEYLKLRLLMRCFVAIIENELTCRKATSEGINRGILFSHGLNVWQVQDIHRYSCRRRRASLNALNADCDLGATYSLAM